MKWENRIINILENLIIENKINEQELISIKNAIKVFKDGKGYLTNKQPIQIFFFSDLDNDDYAI